MDFDFLCVLVWWRGVEGPLPGILGEEDSPLVGVLGEVRLLGVFGEAPALPAGLLTPTAFLEVQKPIATTVPIPCSHAARVSGDSVNSIRESTKRSLTC